MHLNAEELVDIAEGTRPESAAPHLAACEPCRAQLSGLRAMMSAAQEVGVPEPSPLFWDHLSSRVSEAVAAEAVPRRSWFDVARWSRGVLDPMLAVAAVAVLIAIVIPGTRVLAPAPVLPPASMFVAAPPPATAVADARPELLSDLAPENDPSLTLVATLTDDVDLETAREAGLTPRGSAEHAVTHMSDGELRELGRLLKAELARSGA
jgi:hypothetical protein